MSLSRVLLSEKMAVASEHPLASLAGHDVLRKGGNAVDAAIATSFALAVTLHPAGGLGGDFFALVYESKTGKVHCLNSSGWAPSGLTLDLLKSRGDEGIPLFGPTSVVVPGTVAGLSAIHERFGTIDFESLPAAALGYARKGFPASETMCRSVGANFGSLSRQARKTFAPNGRPPRLGDRIRQERLAKVIEDISENGAQAFYRGTPAESICETLSQKGVPTRISDFASFRPEWVQPLRMEYNGYEVFEVPPNSMGATCLLMLKLLSEEKLSRTKPLSPERVKLTMDAAEFAYVRRDAMLGDPKFGKIDLSRFMDTRRRPNLHRGSDSRGGDTTAFSIVDRDGNIVSGIQSLFHHFGSKVFVEDCGLMLNNRAAGFGVAGPNRLEPRKRPLHTLSAVLLTHGEEPKFSIGCSGGDFRPMQHALFITNIVDYSMALEQSIDHPRFLRTGPGAMLAEEGYANLGGLPYEVQRLRYPGTTGVCQGLELLPRAVKAVCDVRGDGLPVGS